MDDAARQQASPSLAGLRVGFAGTPEFAAQALQALVDAGAQVILVLTQPDRPSGRGLRLHASAVKRLATQCQLPVLQPQGLRLGGKFAADAAAAHEAIVAAGLDAMVVAAYGLILPAWVLQAPRWGCFNIHGSLLPRWRGAAPIHRAIEAGDTHTGVTIMQMDEGLDTGDMLSVRVVPIGPTDTTASLHDTLAQLGAREMVKCLHQAASGALIPVAQPKDGPDISYAQKIDKAQARLDWHQPASLLARRVRAFNPAPGAWTNCRVGAQTELWKVWDCYEINSNKVNECPGKVRISSENNLELVVDCGTGSLALTAIQRAGATRQNAKAFTHGLLQNHCHMQLD